MHQPVALTESSQLIKNFLYEVHLSVHLKLLGWIKMFILATATSCVRNIELIQILHKILNQIRIATEMTLQKIETVIVILMSVY